MEGLFKYFPADLYKVEKLMRHQILLTPPKYFNDPWDFLVRREPVTDDEIRALFEKFESEVAGNVDLEEFKSSVTRSEFLEREGSEMQDGLSKMFGVVSLTGDPCNRLMWAYYADSHRGFVAEFDHGPKKEAQGVEAMMSPFGIAIKVAYEPNLQKFKADFSNSTEVYFTKHQKWAHEEEWRVIESLSKALLEPKNGKTFYLLPFNPKFLVRIIVGLRVDPEVEKRLSEMLRAKEFAHVKMEKMKIDASSGELVCC